MTALRGFDGLPMASRLNTVPLYFRFVCEVHLNAPQSRFSHLSFKKPLPQIWRNQAQLAKKRHIIGLFAIALSCKTPQSDAGIPPALIAVTFGADFLSNPHVRLPGGTE
jgi:hypothetical protein